MNGMKKKSSFCITYTLQIRLDILLDYGMLRSHFHMKFMVCRHLPPALEKRHFFSRTGKAMVCHAGCHAGFGSNERLYQLTFTDHGRGKEKNLSLKSAGHNENQHFCSLQWHMIAHHWLSVRRCLRITHSLELSLWTAAQILILWHLFAFFLSANPYE